MTEHKRISVKLYLPPYVRDKYSDGVIQQNTARHLIIAGFTLVQTRDVREYVLLGKGGGEEKLRVYFMTHDPIMMAAYEVFTHNQRPEMYWTSLYMIGLEAIFDKQLPAWLSPALPYPVPSGLVSVVGNIPMPQTGQVAVVTPPAPPPPKVAAETVAPPVEPKPAVAKRDSLKGLMAGGKTRKLGSG